MASALPWSNALCTELVATVRRDGAEWEHEVQAPASRSANCKKIGPARGSGSTVFFHPDPTIFPKTDFNADTIRDRLEVTSYLHRGLKVVLQRPATAARSTPSTKSRAWRTFSRRSWQATRVKPTHEVPFTLRTRKRGRVEVVFQWTDSTDERILSYVNGIPTGSGGTHENGLRAGVTKAIRNYVETHKLTPRGVTITAEDIREGLVGVLSVFIADPQFQGQTKDRLNNPEVQSAGRWRGSARARAVAQFEPHGGGADRRPHHPGGARPRGVARSFRGGIAQDGHRRPADAAGQAERLHELESTRTPSSSSSRETRPAGLRSKAAIALLRLSCPCAARCLNTESVSLKKVLENKELSDLVTALGCGVGTGFDFAEAPL